MRVFLSHRTWISAGILCLPCLLSSGCKSTGPGMGWLSWAKPKPLSTSLSSNVPTKPSVNSLPPPSSTTGALGPATGSGSNLAQLPNGQGSGFGAAPGSAPNNGYYTGPYGMAGQSATPPPANANPAYAASGFGGAQNANQNPAAGYGGYQSPYQSASAPAGNAYRTADSRNSPSGALPGANGGSAAAGTHSWNNGNNEQWGRSEPRGVSQPAGYTEPPRGFDVPQGGAGQGVDASSTLPPSTSTTPGGYRPGSTGRSTGSLPSAATSATALPSTSTYRAPGGAYPAPSYPASSYPASTYPAVDNAAARSANSTGYAGGYAYPSTSPTR